MNLIKYSYRQKQTNSNSTIFLSQNNNIPSKMSVNKKKFKYFLNFINKYKLLFYQI